MYSTSDYLIPNTYTVLGQRDTCTYDYQVPTTYVPGPLFLVPQTLPGVSVNLARTDELIDL